MQQRERLRHRLKIQSPVERAIATADDEHITPTEILHLPHRVEDRLVLVSLDARQWRTLRGERAAACGDDHDFALEHLASVGGEAKATVDPLQRVDALIEMKLRAERLDLLHKLVGQLLAGDHGERGNVVDWLLRVKLGALTARPIENVDQMRLDIDEAELEYGEKRHGACAHDHGIGFDHSFGHCVRL